MKCNWCKTKVKRPSRMCLRCQGVATSNADRQRTRLSLKTPREPRWRPILERPNDRALTLVEMQAAMLWREREQHGPPPLTAEQCAMTNPIHERTDWKVFLNDAECDIQKAMSLVARGGLLSDVDAQRLIGSLECAIENVEWAMERRRKQEALSGRLRP